MCLTAAGSPHLADVVEVTVRRALLRQELFVGIELHVQVELLLQQQQPVVTERLDRAHAGNAQNPAQMGSKLEKGATTRLRHGMLL